MRYNVQSKRDGGFTLLWARQTVCKVVLSLEYHILKMDKDKLGHYKQNGKDSEDLGYVQKTHIQDGQMIKLRRSNGRGQDKVSCSNLEADKQTVQSGQYVQLLVQDEKMKGKELELGSTNR